MARHSVTDFLSVFRDISARFCDAETDLLILLDSHGCIERVYPGFTKALGYTEENVLRCPIIDLIDLDTLAVFVKSFGWKERETFRMLHRGGGLVAVKMEWYEFVDNHCSIILRLVK